MSTLSTLIEACGEGFGALGREHGRWVACEYVSERGEWSNAHDGETPDDAVARPPPKRRSTWIERLSVEELRALADGNLGH
jgi:hypothetical protein